MIGNIHTLCKEQIVEIIPSWSAHNTRTDRFNGRCNDSGQGSGIGYDWKSGWDRHNTNH